MNLVIDKLFLVVWDFFFVVWEIKVKNCCPYIKLILPNFFFCLYANAEVITMTKIFYKHINSWTTNYLENKPVLQY